MDFEWITIALGDVVWLTVAFVLGLGARSIGLPPLVGFLATGFVLNLYGFTGGEVLQKLSDLGITLLLFVVGLKLNLRTFVRPHVWAVTGIHTSLVVLAFGSGIYLLTLLGTPFLAGLDFAQALLIAFALSFSSTVFAVKVLDEKDEAESVHGQIAVGILIVQDLAAAAFLGIAAGHLPTLWAIAALLLIPLRPLLILVLQRVGHGELLVLYGLVLALGGAEIFELVGLKGDIGALALGVLISSHIKAEEMAKTMLGFKDLFLLGFFLSIGLSGQITMEAALIGAAITPFVFLKSALFFGLLTRFRLQARTALLTSLNLSTFSEFGLIVAAIGVTNGWIDSLWLIVLVVALSLSCVLAAGLNAAEHTIYTRHRAAWKRWQRPERISDDPPLDIGRATIAVFGMGNIGTAAYETMHQQYGGTVIGVDSDPVTVERRRASGCNVLLGDPNDADFWDRVQATHSLELVMLTLPHLAANLAVLEQLKVAGFDGRVAALARFEDEIEPLEEAGASTVFNVAAEAGSGFATHVAAQTPSLHPDPDVAERPG